MKNKRIWKIGLSLLIALVFILPTGAMADREGPEASDGQTDFVKAEKNFGDGSEYPTNDVRSQFFPADQPLAIKANVSITDINLLHKMPVDCYDVNITLWKKMLVPGTQLCDIKAFMDIFKAEDMPKEEMLCFDFEDTWDIYNYWDSVDDTTDSTSGPGGIDTWTRSDVRSHSPSYSFHCTQFDDHYMGNQLDYLMAHMENTEDYAEIVVEFWQICFGETIDDGDGNTVLEDYGWCEYSFDGTNWVDTFDNMETWEQYFYSNETWDTVGLTIPGTTGETDIYFRFAWTSGPTIQNEGWYVDDVCFYGREAAGLGNLVFTTHSLQEFTLTQNYTDYEFPETWCPDEGDYTIRIWLLSETKKCRVLNPQNDPFLWNVTIGDVLDLNVTTNCIVSPLVSPFIMGDDLHVEGTVRNDGTVDATDIPVTFSVKETITEVAMYDLFESGVGDWHGYLFSGGSDDFPWHITDYNSVSPTHSFTCMNETAGPDYHGLTDNLAAGIMSPPIDWTTDDPLTIDFQCEIMYELGPGSDPEDGVYPYLGGDDIGHYMFGLSLDVPWENGILGNSSGWIPFSFNKWFTMYTNYWEVNTYPDFGGYGELDGLVDWLNIRRDDHPEYDWTNLGFGFLIQTPGGPIAPIGEFAGFFFDNAKIVKTYPGAERYKEVIIIDELKAETPSESAESEDVDFYWEDMPTGDFVEEKSVPSDDNNDNNMLSEPFEVVADIAEVDPDDVEHYDLTEGMESHWHVTTSGYNNYLWCGEEDTGTYGDSWNDVLLFAPSSSPQDPELDWSGLSNVCLELDEYAECLSNDHCILEINPHVKDPGYDWYQYKPQLTSVVYSENFDLVPPMGTIVDYAGNGDVWGAWAYGTPYMGPPRPLSPWYDWVVGDFPPLGDVNYMGIWTGVGWPNPYIETGYRIGPLDLTGIPLVDVQYYATHYDFDAYVDTYFTIDVYSGGTVYPDNYETSGDPGDMNPFGPGSGFNSDDLTYTVPPYDGVFHTPIGGIAGFDDPSQVYFEFYYYNDYFGQDVFQAFDDIDMWSSEPLAPGVGRDYGWQHTTYDFRTDNFFHPITGDTYLMDFPGGFTDEMGFRIRFISDADYHERGVLLDNIYMHGSGDIFELDECDNLDNFMLDVVRGGDYWYYEPGYGGWICNDTFINGIPNDVDCALVWETSVPCALSAELHFDRMYNLSSGDYCYLEFSTDGGDSWIAPVRYTGLGSGPVTIDMSSFTGDNVLIRWRVDTNESGISTIYKVKDMRITAKIDVNPPITTGTLTGTVIHGWYSSPVTFTATAWDDVSGVAATYYKIDGGSQITYSAPITISVNGEHYVEYWSVDKVGNEEIHHTTPTFKIDTGSAPSVAITAPGDGLFLFGNQLLSLSGKTIIIGGFTVEATASDADSGVYRVQFALDGATFGESTSAPYSAYCGEKHTGAGTITVTAEDFTGNTATASKDITYFKFL